MMHRKNIWSIMIYVSLVFYVFSSCKKENIDFDYDYRPYVQAQKKSNIRLVNLSFNEQLIVDDDTLTNYFLAPTVNTPIKDATPPGTRYFPKNGRLGSLWDIPQDLLNNKGAANFKSDYIRRVTGPHNTYSFKFSVKEEANTPQDIYLQVNRAIDDSINYLKVPRSVIAPKKADHFKIRVLNLSRKLNATSSMENLQSSISLAYADGSKISANSNDIEVNKWSDYVEIPYGTYQFKVLTSDGRQIPNKEQSAIIERNTSTMVGVDQQETNLVYAPIHTYQPGGIYTIVVHPSEFTWNNGQDDITELQNGFRIIADIPEPVNNSYSRVQVANTLFGINISVKIKGKTSEIATPGHTSTYMNVITGKEIVDVLDENGKSLHSFEYQILAGQNYTIWIYEDLENKIIPLVVPNNLAGSSFLAGESISNQVVDRMKSNYPVYFRFLNLCPQIPKLTVTFEDGSNLQSTIISSSSTNLLFGEINLELPYSEIFYQVTGWNAGSYKLLAYQSDFNQIPGNWLRQISPFVSTDFIANPELYSSVKRGIPKHEPGIYSLAIIGNLNNNTSNKARFMLVKHNQ